jgi:23S rRNA (uracil1939-C5)-methyltransferase
MPLAAVESLDREGRGVARVDGKAIFIEGALAGEVVQFTSFRKKPNYELAQVTAVERASGERVEPRCKHFGVCGGCSMQHLEPKTQVAAKQRVLEDNLWHIGKVKAGRMLSPIHGPSWGYRERARLTSRFVVKKDTVLVGFHERKSSFVADMDSCEVLPPALSDLLVPLRNLVGAMAIRERMPQIEVAIGEHVTVLVLRNLEAVGEADAALLRAFAEQRHVQIWLQPKGPDTAYAFWPLDVPRLDYSLPEFGVTLEFSPTDFTQVNQAVNQVMVRRAIALLDPQPGELIGDMFCGLGNFTLPIAACGANVVGVEVNAQLVGKGERNAAENGLESLARFDVANLFVEASCAALPRFDKLLIDPPREGAVELLKAIGEDGPWRIVYVSCDPATLARDAGFLVHEKGYELLAAGVINMFPHTSHVESIALFERPRVQL